MVNKSNMCFVLHTVLYKYKSLKNNNYKVKTLIRVNDSWLLISLRLLGEPRYHLVKYTDQLCIYDCGQCCKIMVSVFMIVITLRKMLLIINGKDV